MKVDLIIKGVDPLLMVYQLEVLNQALDNFHKDDHVKYTQGAALVDCLIDTVMDYLVKKESGEAL